MTGKTHFRVGLLSYIILFLLGCTWLGFLGFSRGFSFVGLVITGLGALMPDIDTKRSKINRWNPLMVVNEKLFNIIEGILNIIIRLIFTVGLGVLILIYKAGIISNLSLINIHVSYTLLYVVAIVLIFVGVLNSSFIKIFPVVNILYNTVNIGLDNIFDFIKQFSYKLTYYGLALGLAYYNYVYANYYIIYGFCLILIAVVTFPHRTFFHSIVEGLILHGLIAVKTAELLGYSYLGWCYFLGLFSHIILTDGLTKDGVYLTVIHKILDKIYIGDFLKSRFDWYKKFYIVVDKLKFRLALMSTGTTQGNIFEILYVALLIILCVVLYYKNSNNFMFVFI